MKARRAILFSGHMIDRPDRDEPRFPPTAVQAAATAIGAVLDELQARSDDLGFCGGACGGDLLFAEALLARDGHLQIHLALPEPEFLEASVAFAGPDWVSRYRVVSAHPRTTVVAPPPDDAAAAEPFARANLAMLDAAHAAAADAPVLVTLWDGRQGDGQGGTDDMVRRVRDAGGEVRIVDPGSLR